MKMKKIIAVIMAAMMISSFGLIANAENAGTVYLCGDTDESGETALNANDLAFLRKVLLGVDTAKGMCDVNEDNNIDILDFVRLKKMLSAETSGVTLSQGTNSITDSWN